MMNRSIALVLAVLLMGLTGAWAQNLGVTGGHVGSHGCFLCHTPHSKGAIEVTNANNTGLLGSTLGPSLGAGVTQPVHFNLASAGQNLAGTAFLWANPLTQASYLTWDGSHSIQAASLTTQSPAIHTILCLSCHDSSMQTSGTMSGLQGGGPGGTTTGGCGAAGCTPAAGTGNAPFAPPNMNGIGQVFWTNAGTNNGWAVTGSLQSTHPVDVAWPNTNGTGSSAYWNVTVASGVATFTDPNFALGDGNTGHPAKLYVDSNGAAWVECSSCHEPHRYGQYAYQKAPGASGTWYFGNTTDYLRGPYATNGFYQANFCRGCHYEKAMAYITAGGVAQ